MHKVNLLNSMDPMVEYTISLKNCHHCLSISNNNSFSIVPYTKFIQLYNPDVLDHDELSVISSSNNLHSNYYEKIFIPLG